MRGGLSGAIVAGTVLFACSAGAQQVTVSTRAGVSAPSALGLTAGPSLSVDGAVTVFRLLAVELTVEQSVHLVTGTVNAVPAGITAADVGLQYRLDVASVIPYASTGLELHRAATNAGVIDFGLGGYAAVGVLLPLGEHWFAGAEARYAAGADGRIPVRQLYALSFGWRSGAF